MFDIEPRIRACAVPVTSNDGIAAVVVKDGGRDEVG